MFTWLWWFWRTFPPASLFFHKINDDCFHMLFLFSCFKISSPNGVLLFRWLLPQAIIHCSFPVLVFWYYQLTLLLLFHYQSLWCSITNFFSKVIYSLFSVHFQLLLFGIILYLFFFLFHDQSLWCLVTNFH